MMVSDVCLRHHYTVLYECSPEDVGEVRVVPVLWHIVVH
jgi:hypothetical protein